MKRKAESYLLMEPSKKQKLSIQNAEKYKLIESNKKQELRIQNREKYRLMDSKKKQELCLQNAEKYRGMDCVEKKDLIKQTVTRRKEVKEKMFFYLFTRLLHSAIQSSYKGRSLLYLCSVQ